MGTNLSDVKASIELTTSGRLQGYIAGSAANLGPVRIISLNAHLTGADGEITIQDATTATGDIKIHLKGGSTSNDTLNFNFGGKQGGLAEMHTEIIDDRSKNIGSNFADIGRIDGKDLRYKTLILLWL